MNPDDRERLVRIETKLDTALTSIADHETRIRSNEKRQWIIAGALLVLTPLLQTFGIKLPT